MGFIIDAVMCSEHLDSSGEILSVKGCDISSLLEGKGYMNWEHSKEGEDAYVGRIIYAKKIFDLSDCEDDRQKYYFEKTKTPLIYIKGELFDDTGHPAATAIAAAIRHSAIKKEKMLLGTSVEGSTLEREGNKLLRTVARGLAITARPCNHSAIADMLHDPETQMEKTESKISYEVDAESFEELNKTLTAGIGNVAPSNLTGGSALGKEQLINGKKKFDLTKDQRNTLKAKLRDWDKSETLESVIKAALPEVSQDYIDHFTDAAKQVILKKEHKMKELNELLKSIPPDGTKNLELIPEIIQNSVPTGARIVPEDVIFAMVILDESGI
jgi:hypothetical protein